MKSKEAHHEYFEEVIKQHKGILHQVARTYCSSELDRQDLIQEMMIQIWKALDRYDSTFKMSTWLYRICLNVAISFYRKNVHHMNHLTLNEDIHQMTDEDKPDYEEQLILLNKFITGLKEIDKALMLLYLNNKSHAEIAEIIGISVSNVGTKIGRIKNRLKNHFNRI